MPLRSIGEFATWASTSRPQYSFDTRQGTLLEEQGMNYLADIGPDNALKPTVIL